MQTYKWKVKQILNDFDEWSYFLTLPYNCDERKAQILLEMLFKWRENYYPFINRKQFDLICLIEQRLQSVLNPF